MKKSTALRLIMNKVRQADPKIKPEKFETFLYICENEGCTTQEVHEAVNSKMADAPFWRELKSLGGDEVTGRGHNLLGWIKSTKTKPSRHYPTEKGKEVLRYIEDLLS